MSNGGQILDILIPILRLVLLTLVGFALFRIRRLSEVLLKPLVWIILNIVFPLYFIHTFPSQWDAAGEAGWIWAGVFAAAYLVFLGLQLLMARLLINRVSFLKTDYPREFLVIFAMHNAGYVPLPIVSALAPAVVSLYVSFYVVPFMILFFTVAAWLIQGAAGQKARITINGPLIGIALGLILAATGIYNRAPEWVQVPFRFGSRFALDAIMVVLGAILGSIPRRAIRYRKEFGGYVLVKLVLFPAIVFVVMLMVTIRGMDADVAAGIKLAMVVEAAAPPATNIMVLTRAYGADSQVEYAGSAIIYSYLASAVIIPIFLILSKLFLA